MHYLLMHHHVVNEFYLASNSPPKVGVGDPDISGQLYQEPGRDLKRRQV